MLLRPVIKKKQTEQDAEGEGYIMYYQKRERKRYSKLTERITAPIKPVHRSERAFPSKKVTSTPSAPKRAAGNLAANSLMPNNLKDRALSQ